MSGPFEASDTARIGGTPSMWVPFDVSQTLWSAIAALPPFPAMKTVPPAALTRSKTASTSASGPLSKVRSTVAKRS